MVRCVGGRCRVGHGLGDKVGVGWSGVAGLVMVWAGKVGVGWSGVDIGRVGVDLGEHDSLGSRADARWPLERALELRNLVLVKRPPPLKK